MNTAYAAFSKRFREAYTVTTILNGKITSWTNPKKERFLIYFSRTWMVHENRSYYKVAYRTNNETEVYNKDLKRHCGERSEMLDFLRKYLNILAMILLNLHVVRKKKNVTSFL